ncbi:MAG: YncE family protein, partial [Deltaproteobacteria bacterium]|nr:YncE family protein [Deltaproteobacteria bacterium]
CDSNASNTPHLFNVYIGGGPQACLTPTTTPTETPTSVPPSLHGPCIGECNNDGVVTVDEVVTMVNIDLEDGDVSLCSVGDADLDGRITIDEILAAVDHVLFGCPAQPEHQLTLVANLPEVGSGGLATDGTYLYLAGSAPVSQGCNGAAQSSAICDQAIFRVPLTGGMPTVLYPALNPAGIAVVDGKLFWIDPNAGPVTDTEILAAPSSGAGPIAPIYVGANLGQPIIDGFGLTTDEQKLYASDDVGGNVFALNVDGTGLTQLNSLPRWGGGFFGEQPNALAWSHAGLFDTNSGSANLIFPPQVVSMADSGNAFSTLADGSPLARPYGITVHENDIFVSDPGSSTIWRLSTGGGALTPFLSNPPVVSLGAVLHWDRALYLVDNGPPAAVYKVGLDAGLSVVAAVPLPDGFCGVSAVNAQNNRVYVNGGSNAQPMTAVVDGSSETYPVETIVNGWGAGVDRATGRYWTGAVYSGDALIYDGATNAQIGTAAVGDCPMTVRIDATRRFAYVAAQCGSGDDRIFIVNADSFADVAYIPSGGIQQAVAVNEATGTVYMCPGGAGSSTSKRFDTIAGLTTSGFNCVGNDAINRLTNTLYASGYASGSGGRRNTVQVVDGSTNEVTTNISVSGVSGPGAVDTTSNRLYLLAQSAIVVIDGSNNGVVGRFVLGPGIAPGGMAVDSTRSLLYVAGCEAGGKAILFVLRDATVGSASR